MSKGLTLDEARCLAFGLKAAARQSQSRPRRKSRPKAPTTIPAAAPLIACLKFLAGGRNATHHWIA
jgi:hypothetical protein